MNEVHPRKAAPDFSFDGASVIAGHLRESIAAKEGVAAHCVGDMERAGRMIAEAFAGGHKLLLCGNGGSAGDCQHIAGEFVSVLTQTFPREGLPAVALTTDTSLLTASANDFGFDGIFERQVQALGAPGDALIGITTSGNSANVLRAVDYARAHGMGTIGLTGRDGGKLKSAAEITVCVPSDNTQHIQEAHITIGHILCALVEYALFDGK